MLESSSCSVEEASAEAQGQEPDKLEDAPLPCYEKGCNQSPPRCPGQEAIHSQWKVIMSSCAECQSPLCPVLVMCEGVWVYRGLNFGGIIGGAMCGGANDSIRPQWMISDLCTSK